MTRWPLILSLALGCAKPAPVLVHPAQIDGPLANVDALGKTDAAQKGRAGTTVLEYCITPEGKVDKLQVTQSQDEEVDVVFVEQVRRRTYEPATRDGVPYELCTTESFDFRPAAPLP